MLIVKKALPEAEERHQLRISYAIDPKLAMLSPLPMLIYRLSGNRVINFWGNESCHESNESYGGEELHPYSITGPRIFAHLIFKFIYHISFT